jgi:signal transduction histidine kinase
MPLVGMKGYVDYVLEEKTEPLPGRVRESLGVVKRGLDQLLSTTNAVLEIRREELGLLQLELESLDFRGVVEDCIAEVQPSASKKQRFRLELPDVPLTIQGDRAKLNQVLTNLLSNALTFAPGSEITLRVRELNDTVSVQVSDTGIGIRKEDLGRVFEPFAAIQKPTQFLFAKGAGLGLSVSKGLVEAHGGKIWAESEGEGKGATFTFTLPKQNKTS